MAENELAVAEPTTEEDFVYPITIEDAGPGAKKVSVEIPADRISAKLEEQFKELRQQAAIPGFRKGHAPRKLIEKRFASDVRDEVRRSLISESYQQAIEKNSLQVLGEPDFENPDAIKLPDEGALSYSFSVEVQPEFAVPELKGITVKRPKIDIKEENVDQAMQNLREQQGTLVPIEDRGVEKGDYLIADVHVKLGDEILGHQHDAQIVARAGRLGGIQIDDLDTQLLGLKPTEKRSIKVTAPETHANEKIRGKEVEIEVALKDLKKLELAEVTPEFLEDLGFANEGELRAALREQMVEKIDYDVKNNLRDQVYKHLLETVNVELPPKMSDRQVDRVVSRRAVDLMMRGMPRDQVEANIERLRGGAREEALRELKLYFILQKVAAEQAVDVNENELNGQVAMAAAQRGMRPEKMKQQMSKDGTLQNLYIQMREQKAIDKILEQAQIEEVEVKPGEEAAVGEKKE